MYFIGNLDIIQTYSALFDGSQASELSYILQTRTANQGLV